MQLSVVMIVKNEAANLRQSLPPLQGLADEIVILDSGSRDESRAVAEAFGARWFTATDWPGFGPQRQRAQALARGAWILALDADEVLSEELVASIRAVVAQAPARTVYGIRRLDYIFGRRIDCPWWRLKAHWRLYPATTGYEDHPVHEAVRIEGYKTATLPGFIHHYTTPTPHYWLEKRLSYAEIWAKERHQRGQSISMLGILWHMLGTFLKQYLGYGRFLCGNDGLIYALLHTQYTFQKYALLYDLGRFPEHYQQHFSPHAITAHNLSPRPPHVRRKHTLSVVMVIKDEEQHLAACLDAIADLADEIVILDAGSRDQSRAIAQHYGARWLEAQTWQGVGIQRQRAQSHAHGDFILALDANEIVDAQLARAIAEVLEAPRQAQTVYALAEEDYGCGRPINWGRRRQVRLYPAHYSFDDHPRRPRLQCAGARVQKLHGRIKHYCGANLARFFHKSLRSAQATTAPPPAAWQLPCLLWRRFFWEYLGRGGIVRGAYGLIFACARAGARFNRALISWQRQQ